MIAKLFSWVRWYHFFYFLFVVLLVWRCGGAWKLRRGGWFLFILAGSVLFAAIVAFPLTLPVPWLNGALIVYSALYLLEWPISLFFPRFRRFLNKAILVSLPLLVAFGLWNGTRRLPAVRAVTVSWLGVPASLQGFTIVQASDLHAGPEDSLYWLGAVVKLINRQNPDIIALTGDTLSGCLDRERFAILKNLRARFGIFVVPGNHERSPESALPCFPRLAEIPGTRILRNEVVMLSPGLQVAGIWDERERIFENKPQQWSAHIQQMRAKLVPNLPVVLLCHNPSPFVLAAQAGVNLMLSGHLHGGQLLPVNLVLRLMLPYLHGMYHSGNSVLILSAGVGVWEYLPLRIGTRGEIIRLRLQQSITN